MTRQTMDDRQAISVGEALLSNVSGVTQGISGIELFTVRGFYSTVGNIYKNGLMEYRLRNLDTTNLQSIEVLKGPAAMLFGRGEPGGIINLVVKRPLETPYFSLHQQVKSFGETRTTLDATGPLNDEKSVLYRFNGEFYSTDSYRNFVTDRNLFIAPTITIRPIEQFKMNIDFEYQNKTSHFHRLSARGVLEFTAEADAGSALETRQNKCLESFRISMKHGKTLAERMCRQRIGDPDKPHGRHEEAQSRVDLPQRLAPEARIEGRDGEDRRIGKSADGDAPASDKGKLDSGAVESDAEQRHQRIVDMRSDHRLIIDDEAVDGLYREPFRECHQPRCRNESDDTGRGADKQDFHRRFLVIFQWPSLFSSGVVAHGSRK
ncbi:MULTISPECIES: TonB-dependent siderophore receptor [Methylosinus]|uniref:TonB-dependent siderophore receptor n=1 Tax=Methylosinus TaxID=425 RepID=UPI0031BBB5C4